MEANFTASTRLNQHNSHRASLTERGMEVAIPPGKFAPNARQESRHNANKQLPPLPTEAALDFRTSKSRLRSGITSPKGRSTRLWKIDTTPIPIIPQLPQRSPLRYSGASPAKRATSPRARHAVNLQDSQHSSLRLSEDIPKPPPSSPILTKSSQKILQLTGFDPRIERVLPIEHQQISRARSGSDSPLPDDSSAGSKYSQPELVAHEGEGGYKSDDEAEDSLQVESRWSSSSSAKTEKGVLQSSSYRLTDYMSGAVHSSTSTPRRAQSPSNIRTRNHSNPGHTRTRTPEIQAIPRQSTGTEFREVTTLKELLEQERVKYEAEMLNRRANKSERHYRSEPNLVPKPLALRPQLEKKHHSLDATPKPKPSLLRGARDSLDIGIAELTPPLLRPKPHNKVAEPAYDESLQPRQLARKAPPPALKPSKNRFFGTGNHPLESPFPFIRNQDPEGGDTENSPFRRISWTMKHRSTVTSSTKSPKRTIISNNARRASGPDTPMPKLMPKSGFTTFLPALEETTQNGVSHLQDMIKKVKKTVRFKTAEERKRESLKKSIVVVGISDQSPDGRVAEWL